jgi:heat shock protein HslJ
MRSQRRSGDAFSLRPRQICRATFPDAARAGLQGLAGRTATAALALAWFIAMTAPAASAQQIEGVTWRAESVKGSAVTGAAPMLSIAGGRLTGSGGCNRIMGSADLSGDRISFGRIASTRMACPPPAMAQEQNFFAALAATRAFRMQGGRLILVDQTGAETVRFVQQS